MKPPAPPIFRQSTLDRFLRTERDEESGRELIGGPPSPLWWVGITVLLVCGGAICLELLWR